MDLKDKYIGVSGNIGSGKTFLCEKFKEKGFKIHQEPYKENPFLTDFYQDPKMYGFPTQIFFFTERIETIRENDHVGVWDRTIFEDPVFVENLCKRGEFEERLKNLYDKLFKQCTRGEELPDFLIHVDVTPETCLSRIQKRGRDFEKTINIDYLNGLCECYATFIQSMSEKIPVFVITEDNQSLEIDKLIEKIQKELPLIKNGRVYID